MGDQVWWRIGSKDQYSGTRLARGVSEDGEWVFIEGVPNGVPKEQVFVMTTTQGPTPRSQMPPPNPFAAASPLPIVPPSGEQLDGGEWGVPPLRFPLAKGNVIEIRLKSLVSRKEFGRIKQLLELSEPSFVEDERDGPDGGDDTR